ncbi:MAG: phosphoglycerate dehydrogenase [Phycisphaeraceae bacterium]|nr:phosphoglycerate dehydrogenase [Phycisphaeraceae bacterium]
MTNNPAPGQKFRILAADKLDEEGLDYIRSQPDAELVNKPGISEDELAAIAGDHDGMIVRSAVQVTAKVLANPGRLKAVARAGVGVDNIDLDAATDKGILVMNSADASTISTAEHAFALLIALARQIGPAYKVMTEGGWDRNKFMGRQLAGKTLGVVGFGRIGRTVAERALAFGMTVVAYDPVFNQPTALEGKVRVFQQFREMLPHAHMLTFHVPLSDQTRGMLGSETFPLCRDGIMVVNASRGGVVDEEALLAALDSGKCAGAALDVFVAEPLAKDSPLRKHPKVLLTPHLGASTKEAQKAVAVAAAEQLMTFLRGQGIVGAVNAGGLRIDLSPVQAAFVDLAQRMTRLLAPMITQGIGSVAIELAGKELASVAGTLERYALVGLLGGSLDIPVNVINVASVARQRGVQLRTILSDDQTDHRSGPQLTIEVNSADGKEERRIIGRVYDDMRPRVIEINGYRMDMIPEGAMILILNEDRPGMIGMVGTEFGQAKVNIADMTISRRQDKALMVLKVDDQPSDAMLNRLQHRPGILKVAVVKLPPEKN